MKTEFSRSAFFLTVLVSLCSCGKNEAPGLSTDEFSDLYGRLMIVAETVQPTNDSLAHLKKLKIDSVLAEFRISETQFQSMADYYREKPEVWISVLKNAAARLDSLRSRTGETSRKEVPRREKTDRDARARARRN